MIMIILLGIIITKTFMLGNSIIMVEVSQNSKVIVNIQNSSTGIDFLLNSSNDTVFPKYLQNYMINSTWLIIPYYLLYNNLTFSVSDGINYANVSINVYFRSFSYPTIPSLTTSNSSNSRGIIGLKFVILFLAVIVSLIAYIYLVWRNKGKRSN